MGPLRDLGADQGKSYDHEVSTLLGDTLAGLYCIDVVHCTTGSLREAHAGLLLRKGGGKGNSQERGGLCV